MDSLHKKPPHAIKPCIRDHVSCSPPVPRRPPSPPPPPRVPLPPPPMLSFRQSLSPFLIIMFCGLAVSFLFICYLTCAMRCRTRRRNRETRELEAHEDLLNENLWPVTIHPIWLINTIGLDQSQIEAIQVFKYKRDEKVVEGTDCSICLSEFEDDESLRLLPKCNHAFHVPCIDTWLRSHKNCPLCRAPIIKNNSNTQHEINESNSTESSGTSEETESPVNDSENVDDHHVIEVENSEEIVKTSGGVEETSSGVRVHSDLGDHHHTQGEELVTMRRSFSIGQLVGSKKQISMPKSENKLNESSSSMHIRHKGTKSYSSGHSMRKASSFTSKCRPYNQFY